MLRSNNNYIDTCTLVAIVLEIADIAKLHWVLMNSLKPINLSSNVTNIAIDCVNKPQCSIILSHLRLPAGATINHQPTCNIFIGTSSTITPLKRR